RAESGTDVLLEIAATPGAGARQRGTGFAGRSRRLFRHASTPGTDRRLGQSSIVAARKPHGFRAVGRAPDREIRERRRTPAAELVGLPRRPAGNRVLARTAVSAA